MLSEEFKNVIRDRYSIHCFIQDDKDKFGKE